MCGIVGAVAAGDDLFPLQAQLVGQTGDVVGLGSGIDNVADHLASQLAAGDFQFVGGGEVEAELDAQALGKVGEATGQDGGAQAGVLTGFEQFAGAGREKQALPENAGQHAGIQPGEQGQAAA